MNLQNFILYIASQELYIAVSTVHLSPEGVWNFRLSDLICAKSIDLAFFRCASSTMTLFLKLGPLGDTFQLSPRFTSGSVLMSEGFQESQVRTVSGLQQP